MQEGAEPGGIHHAGAADLEHSIGYQITATESLQELQPRTLKHGNTFGLFDQYGDIIARPGGVEGLFHDDTRYLSSMQVLIEGRRPLLLSSTVQDNNAMLTVDLTNPDISAGNDLLLRKDTIHILRSKFIWQGRCMERLRIQNFGDEVNRVSIEIRFDADFADLFEVRGHMRERRGTVRSEIVGNDSVLFRYMALDGVASRTTVTLAPAPDRLDRNAALYDLTLVPGDQRYLFVSCTCGDTEHGRAGDAGFLGTYRTARRALRTGSSRAASVVTSNHILNETLCRSIADLYMLVTDTEDGPYPYAGTPWFSTVFGRDGIITAIQMLWLDPEIARGVLRFLARNQADAHDPPSDAEPGKILHEMRAGEMARLREVPFARYYGSVDSTPLFVMLAGLYFERTGDMDTIRELWPAIEAALGWIDTHGDIDGDGLIKYARKEAAGLFNQGWKDSQDSVFHDDGRTAELPIALCEVQGYGYAARLHGARLARTLGFAARATELDGLAEQLRKLVEERFWSEELGMYALAVDGDGEACLVRASNAGHLLFCGLPGEERAAKVADALLSPQFFSGWGVRTLAASERRYNPMSYHNGSVWPHDNAVIALGLGRYGFTQQVMRLFRGMFDSASYMDLRRLPELFCGFKRQPGKAPTGYPVACAPQAWASAAPFALLQACLGLQFDAPRRCIRFVRPSLPDFLDDLVIRSLRLGSASVDILVRRHGVDVSLGVLKREGDVAVEVTLG